MTWYRNGRWYVAPSRNNPLTMIYEEGTLYRVYTRQTTRVSFMTKDYTKKDDAFDAAERFLKEL